MTTRELSANIIQSAMLKTRVCHRPSPSMFYFPGLSQSRPIIDIAANKQFQQINEALRENYDAIKQEYLNLLSQSVEKSDYIDESHQTLHTGTWDWKSYILKGKRQTDFAMHAPTTVSVLEGLNDGFGGGSLMKDTPFSFSFFSTMGKKSSIKAHVGPCNLRIRLHFPLIVPEGDCGMEVGGETIRWKEGEPVFFDDTFIHRVWNDTEKERVILLADLWAPELTPDEIAAIVDMFSYASEQKWIAE